MHACCVSFPVLREAAFWSVFVDCFRQVTAEPGDEFGCGQTSLGAQAISGSRESLRDWEKIRHWGRRRSKTWQFVPLRSRRNDPRAPFNCSGESQPLRQRPQGPLVSCREPPKGSSSRQWVSISPYLLGGPLYPRSSHSSGTLPWLADPEGSP